MRGWLAVLFLLGVACKSELPDCGTSTGAIESDTLFPGHFSEIKVSHNVNVTWQYSDSTFAIRRCGKNLKEKVRIESDGNTLKISNQNTCNWVRAYDKPMEINLFSPTPRAVWLDGFGSFTTEDTIRAAFFQLNQYGTAMASLTLAVDFFRVDFSTPGHLISSGKATVAQAHVQGFGKFNLGALAVDSCDLFMEGENDVYLQIRHILTGIHSSGRTVFVSGGAANQMQLKNSGRVVMIP